MRHDLDKIARLLPADGNFTRRGLVCFDEIDSTNSWLLAQPEAHGRVCLAGHQTAGRGRRSKTWAGRPGGSIAVSMGWRLGAPFVPGLSLVSGLAVKQALERCGVAGVALKWPNDILVGGRKLGGVLVEAAGGGDEVRHVVGVGLNLALGEQPGIAQPWTDLAALGLRPDPDQLVADVIQLHDMMFGRLRRSGFQAFRRRWNDCHAFQGREVVVSTLRGAARGRALGVNARGELVVECGGERRAFASGVESVRLADGADAAAD